MRRPFTLILVGALTLLTACGSGAKSSESSASKQLSDPRTAPTATLPAVLPSPVLAGTVTGIPLSGNATATPSVYTVKPGDTMAGIAAQFGIPLAALLAYNADVNPSALKVGQEIRIPPAAATPTPSATASAGRSPTAAASAPLSGTRTTVPGSGTSAAGTPASTPPAGGGQTYTVQSGDTGCKLAATFQVSLQELAEANGTTIAGLANLKVGQQLKVPPPTGSPRGC